MTSPMYYLVNRPRLCHPFQYTAVPDLPMAPQDLTDEVEPMTQDKPDIKPSTSACALDDLFSDTFIRKVEPAKPIIDRANEELLAFKSEPIVPHF